MKAECDSERSRSFFNKARSISQLLAGFISGEHSKLRFMGEADLWSAGDERSES